MESGGRVLPGKKLEEEGWVAVVVVVMVVVVLRVGSGEGSLNVACETRLAVAAEVLAVVDRL